MANSTTSGLPAEKLLTDIVQFQALANPTRMRILHESSGPITVAELAERLGTPTTRLYYHVNLLIETGLLVQVGERKSGARIERIFRVAARNFRPGPGVWETTSDSRQAANLAAGVIFEPARAETAAVLEQMSQGLEPIAAFGRWLVHLTADEAAVIADRIEGLISEFRRDDNRPTPSTTPYAFTYAFARTGADGG